MELTQEQYNDLRYKVTNILHGGYSDEDKNIMATRLYNSKLLSKFLASIQYDSIADNNKELISLVLDCLEYY